MPTPEEISNLCRLCLEKRQVSVLIFEEQTRTRSTFVKISSCLPVKVSKSDALPKKICEVCSGKLDSFYEFWKQSSESEKQLQDWLKQPPPEPAPDPMPVLKQEEVDFKGIGYSNSSNSESAPSTSILSSILQTQVSDEPPLKKTKFVTEPDTILHTYDSDEEIEAKVEQIEDNSNDSNSNGEAEGLDYGDDGQVNPDNPDDQPGPSGVGKSSDETPSASYMYIPCNPTYLIPQLTQEPRYQTAPILMQQTTPVLGPHTTLAFRPHTTPVFRHQATPVFRSQQAAPLFRPQTTPAFSYQASPIFNQQATPIFNQQATPLFNQQAAPAFWQQAATASIKPNQKSKSCELCAITFQTFERLKAHNKHFAIMHLHNVYACEVCPAKYSYKNNLMSHLKVKHKKELAKTRFTCDICNKSLSDRKYINNHLMKHHSDLNYKCKMCNLSFTNYPKRKPLPFACEFCAVTFQTAEKQESHFKSFELLHKHNVYACDYCTEKYSYKSQLKSHLKNKHNKESKDLKFTCDQCDKTFVCRESMLRHLMGHSGDYQFKCKICPKMFSNPKCGKRHMLAHGVHNSVCEICGKTVSSSTYMKIHMRIHTGEKPFKCKTCGKCFSARKYLLPHMVVHTNQRNFVCAVCHKAYTQKSSLNIHMRYHTGERPYQCSVCSKTFITRTLLKNHNCKGPK